MSTDPTQPMSPAAPAGSGRPEQPEPEPRDAAQDGDAPTVVQAPAAEGSAALSGPGGPAAVAETRAEPVQPAVPPTRVMPAQPSFQPAQPSFQPAQPAQPSFQPAGRPEQPGPRADQAARGAAQAAAQGAQEPRGDWPQPSQYSAQPGWPAAGGAPGPGQPAGMAAPAGVAAPGGKGRRGGGKSPYPGYPGGPAPRRRHRGRRWTMLLFGLIVLLILLVIGDRVALAVAENDFADQAVKSGLPVKPSVTIEGFPFLTQLAARDFRRVDLSANNIPAGPVNITSVKATLNGMHLNSSFNGATVDHLTATVFVSFSALASAGGGAGGLTMTADGPDKVKITAGIGPLSDTEVAKVTQTGPNQISVQVLNSGSPLGGILSSFGSFSFSLPKLPVPVHITSVAVTPQGLTLNAAADHANLSQ